MVDISHRRGSGDGGYICVCVMLGGDDWVLKRHRSTDREIDDGVMWRPHRVENGRPCL